MKTLLLSCAVVLTMFASSCSNADAKAQYQCPMKCEGEAKMYDSAGKCPMCGMDMKEVKKDK
jgi:protein SCO1